MSRPDTTKCRACELLIPTACIRCKRPFATHADLQREIDRLSAALEALSLELERRLDPPPPPPQLFPAILPTMDEWKNLLIAEAIRRVGASHAGELIGMGRTSIFRRYHRETRALQGEATHATP